MSSERRMLTELVHVALERSRRNGRKRRNTQKRLFSSPFPVFPQDAAASMWLIIVGVILLLLVWDWFRKTKGGVQVPHSPMVPLLGNGLLIAGDDKHIYRTVRKEAAKHGDVWKLNLFGTEFVCVSGMQVANEVFLAPRNHDSGSKKLGRFLGSGVFTVDSGPHHSSIKKALKPFLMSQTYQPIISRVLNKHCERLLADLRDKASSGVEIEFDTYLNDMVFRAMFDLILGSELAADSNVDDLLTMWKDILAWAWWMVSINGFEYFKLIDTAAHKHNQECERKLYAVFETHVEKLVDRVNASGPDFEPTNILEHYATGADDRSVSHLTDMAINLMWGAYDSTRFTILMGIVEATRHQRLVKQIRMEMRTGTAGDLPIPQELDRTNMPQLHAFVMEVLRLYPAFPFAMATMIQDLTLSTGVTLPANTNVMLCMDVVLRDPRHWGADADQFNPDRWIEHYRTTNSDPKAFRAFGAGARSCPGEKLAQFDVRLFVGALIRDFDFEIKEPEKLDVVQEISLTLNNVRGKVRIAE